jgi:hypothetical protein
LAGGTVKLMGGTMEAKEELIELKPEELDILKTYRRAGGGYGCSIFLAVVVALIFFFLRRVLPTSYWDSALFDVGAIAVAGVAVLFVAFVFSSQWSSNKSANELIERDINGGFKKIITRRVDSQQITGHEDRSTNIYGVGASLLRKTPGVEMSYNLVIDGEAYSADEGLYMKLKPGDKIHFHVGPNSNSILYYTIDSDQRYYVPSALKRIGE